MASNVLTGMRLDRDGIRGAVYETNEEDKGNKIAVQA